MEQDGIRGELRRLFLRTDVFGLAIAVFVGTALFRALYALVEYIAIPFVRGVIQEKPPSDYPSSSIPYSIFNGFTVAWGEVLSTAVTLALAMLLVFYLKKRFAGSDEYEDEADELEFDEQSKLRPCPECLSQIPAMARRCAFCTSHVTPAA